MRNCSYEDPSQLRTNTNLGTCTVTYLPKSCRSWKECKKGEGVKQLDVESEERLARSRYMDALPGRTSNTMQLQRCHLTAEHSAFRSTVCGSLHRC
ncbi:hypothetical protein PISMIDRAFT_426131 [Pisolithus microcarpus 441]|uniref:Uncharacterized protein n=1 Tax=Pisolithus microcarpus 441 TaxID=765257 RepID=A0A0C9ZDE7_9AGAM|nr:hypothetical protein PISMIDRAFT_426131 [Pisolithus microcarpus 441]